jgi:2-keto-4-pentenoate hydratase/2-oxohepta-3-ene-1,7-dioic acid hydratase in catechol pathway
MRYLTYRSETGYRLGALQQNYIVDLGRLVQLNDLLDLIKAGPPTWQEVAARLQTADLEDLVKQGLARPYREELLTAPISRPPKNIICLGRNYDREYYKRPEEKIAARGEVDKPPDFPVYFSKPATSIIGPFDPIPLDPELTQQLDWEAELGVVIGTGGRRIAKEQALQHIFGYTVLNDLTARDLQFRHGQWFKGKGLDGSCPMGPVIVTPDELPDPVHIPIRLRVNGVTKQEANTGQLIFDIPTIIADISETLTLEPGDIISTGTPDGVGHFRKPPEYLKLDDLMETEIEGIGLLRNRIVREALD